MMERALQEIDPGAPSPQSQDGYANPREMAQGHRNKLPFPGQLAN